MRKFDFDDEILGFIESYLKLCNNQSTAISVEQQRSNYDVIVRHFCYPHPTGVTSVDSQVSGRHGPIPIRRYTMQQTDTAAQIVFIHGGGFILGSLDSHDDICAELCATTGLSLTSIDYRLSPEYFHPTHLDDVEDALMACWQTNTILVGISAGATLSAAVCHRLQSANQKPSAQVLIYPGLGGDCFNLESYRSNARAPLLSTEDIRFYRGSRCRGDDLPVNDPEFYPLVAECFSGLPTTIAFSADQDPLRDDAQLYVDKLTAAGVEAKWFNELGLVHDYLRARHISEKARASFSRICNAITNLAQITI